MAREQQQQQGRGRGRFQRGRFRGGRGGRYQGRSRQRNPSPNTNQQKEYKFTPHTQGKPQTATYATVKDHVIQQIQKTFKDGNNVAQSLKDGKVYELTDDEPKRQISEEEDIRAATLEQTGFDIKYQEELRRFLDRKDNLRQGLTKAYALIFTNFCNRTMQSRVEEHPDFEKKLKTIQLHC